MAPSALRGGPPALRILGVSSVVATLFAGVALGSQSAAGSGAHVAGASTSWTRVTSDCKAPPPGPSGAWVQKGDACWDQHAAYGTWTVGDGNASVTQPGFTVNMTWAMPASIPGSASMSVTTTGGVAQRICVLGAYTTFAIEGGGDSCAQTSASKASASATAGLLPMDAPDGTVAYVWLSLGDGGNLFYSYKASSSQPPSSRGLCEGGSARVAHGSALNEVHVVSCRPGCQFHKGGTPADAWLPLDLNTVLKQTDTVSCDPDGEVTLGFADNSVTVLKGVGQLGIASYFVEGGVIHVAVALKMGQIAAEVPKSQATKSDLRIRTPTGTSSARGTQFAVFYEPGSKTTVVDTYQDVVDVTPANPALAPVSVAVGQEVQFTRTAITAPGPIGKVGKRGGLNIVSAVSRVLAVVGRRMASCHTTTPRTNAFSAHPAPRGWSVTVKLRGRLHGRSRWRTAGAKVTPVDRLAKKLARGCR